MTNFKIFILSIIVFVIFALFLYCAMMLSYINEIKDKLINRDSTLAVTLESPINMTTGLLVVSVIFIVFCLGLMGVDFLRRRLV